MMHKTMSVLYLGVHDVQYPRNRAIRSYLEEELSAVVNVVTVERRGSNAQKLKRLLATAARKERYDLVVLSEFAIELALPAKLVAIRFRAPLIVDWFVGLHETRVGDHGRPDKGLKPRIYRILDALAVRLSSFAITDTEVRANAISKLTAANRRVLSLPVGAPDWAKAPNDDSAHEGRTRVLYYGNYVPLHGVETIVEAAQILNGRYKDRFQFTLLGNGNQRESVERRVGEHGLCDMFTFLNGVPEQELAEIIARHDVVLGVFGGSEKAASVIANKVWQGLYKGKPVITRRSPALREISSVSEGLLFQIAPRDGEALATALDTVRASTIMPLRMSVVDGLDRYVQSRYRAFGEAIRLSLTHYRSRKGREGQPCS